VVDEDLRFGRSGIGVLCRMCAAQFVLVLDRDDGALGPPLFGTCCAASSH
jgi:hypothetical protein